MRDALGGTVTISIIVIFIVFSLGYMAFNVNYTKAFRMKDKIVALYEKYHGNCGNACEQEILEYSQTIGYRPDQLTCPDGSKPISGLYCRSSKQVTKELNDLGYVRCYYHIITKINVEIPIFKNMLDLKAFNVVGDTKTLEVEGTSC